MRDLETLEPGDLYPLPDPVSETTELGWFDDYSVELSTLIDSPHIKTYSYRGEELSFITTHPGDAFWDKVVSEGLKAVLK